MIMIGLSPTITLRSDSIRKTLSLTTTRGVAWKNKGEYDLAIADYNTAIKLDKNYVSAYNNRGVALYRKGDNDRALVEYNSALRLAPSDADVYNNRGISFNEKGDFDRAIADYSEAIRLNPKYVNASLIELSHTRRKACFPRRLRTSALHSKLQPARA
jgi:tetratricopeptide (TPR) repeat protein